MSGQILILFILTVIPLSIHLPFTWRRKTFPLSSSCFLIPVHTWIRSMWKELHLLIYSSTNYQSTNLRKVPISFLWLMLYVHSAATVQNSFVKKIFRLNVKMSPSPVHWMSFVYMAPQFENIFVFDFASNTFSFSSQCGKFSWSLFVLYFWKFVEFILNTCHHLIAEFICQFWFNFECYVWAFIRRQPTNSVLPLVPSSRDTTFRITVLITQAASSSGIFKVSL